MNIPASFISDRYLAELSPAAIKVWIVIMHRARRGVSVDISTFSLDDMCRDTGMTHNTVRRAIREIERRNMIERVAIQPMRYIINTRNDWYPADIAKRPKKRQNTVKIDPITRRPL